ncbi:MAG TPA: amidohydrolase family protein [Brevundimonas sp.]|nr:amidohydrolase family protein [Brevundimonas sp.]
MKAVLIALPFLMLTTATAAAQTPPPIIDMHLHAQEADAQGPPGQTICAPYVNWPALDPGEPIGRYLEAFSGRPDCPRRFTASTIDAEIRDRTLAELDRLNVIAVTSGEPDTVELWRRQSPDRIIPGISGALPDVAELRRLHAAGQLQVLGEIGAQGRPMGVNDPSLEPYYALAEELDIPVAIHLGPVAPGMAYFGAPRFRAALNDPLMLEEVLLRHPDMRVYVMHAAYPMADRMIALMYAHPQVYVDIAVIDYVVPRPEFHRYLRRLVEAGFAKRIMFGSDQMVWPETIGVAIEHVESADFLSPGQKRDIFYNNAARFLRLDEATQRTHHGN